MKTDKIILWRRPSVIKGRHVTLRRYSAKDTLFAKKMFENEEVRAELGIAAQRVRSLNVWWWVKKSFICFYWIEVDGEKVGFTGLYGWRPDRSVTIALFLFSAPKRRAGYGTESVDLLLSLLARSKFATRVMVRCRASDKAAISFWKQLSFIEAGASEGVVTLEHELEEHYEPPMTTDK